LMGPYVGQGGWKKVRPFRANFLLFHFRQFQCFLFLCNVPHNGKCPGTCGSGTQIRVESYDTSGLLTASSRNLRQRCSNSRRILRHIRVAHRKFQGLELDPKRTKIKETVVSEFQLQCTLWKCHLCLAWSCMMCMCDVTCDVEWPGLGFVNHMKQLLCGK